MSETLNRVLITGASRGIGYSATEQLLDKNYTVTGTARRSTSPKEFAENGRFTGLHSDLSDLDDVKDNIKPLFQADREDFPQIVVNNAGIIPEHSFELEDSEWESIYEKTLTVNLRAPSRICKWAINRWIETGTPGIIINVSSRAAYRGETEQFSAYAASKSGLVAYTKTLARAFGKNNIVAYSIAPGFIDTDMAAGTIQAYGKDYLTQGIALNELTPPEQIANLISTLASGKLRHMTGSTLHLNGGSYMI